MALYMPLFRSCTSLKSLTQLHGHLLVTGRLCSDPLPATKLVEAYSQMGDVKSSRHVFEAFEAPDSFMWGVLIKCCVWNRSFEDAISLYNKMVYHQVEVNRFIYPSVLRACSGFHFSFGEKVHGRIVKSGLDSDDIIQTCLLSMYGEMGAVCNARKVFDDMPLRDVVSWSSIISTYVDNGDPNGGLDMFSSMVSEGIQPDSITMLALYEACAELGSLDLARSVHGIGTRKIDFNDEKLDNSLIVMYSKCDDLGSAEKLFRSASIRTVASWTAMISSYNQSGCFEEAIDVFLEMQASKVEPNSVTMMSILFSCAKLGFLREGKSVHCFIIKNDIDPTYEFLGPPLMEFYADCRRIHDNKRVFDMIQVKDVVSWNMLISVHRRTGLLNQALAKFIQMLFTGVPPDSYSLAASLSACASLGFAQFGSQIHGYVLKTGSFNEFVQNALIDMYSKCGRVDSAHKLFICIENKGVVTWNSMICGFMQNGYSDEAIRLFHQMLLNRLLVNEVTFLFVFQAIADIGLVEKARWVHGKFITSGLEKEGIYAETAIIDMYCKCGDLETARLIFDSIKNKSVVTWSAMIGGYGFHGQIDSALCLFDQMMESGTRPNDVTLMNVLSSCSHAGYVEKGKFYFDLMRGKFGIEPNMEHFACLVDLLSRSGNLSEAYSVITSMPFPAHASIWSSFLNGCRIHRRTDMIRGIQQNLSDVDTDDTGFHTLLSNIYAEEGNWGESGKMRLTMDSSGLKKVRGYSIV